MPTLHDPDAKLNLLAVGDDDQNIYGFRGADIGFIRQFKTDYQAEDYYLVENYRSSARIIAAASALIEANPARMKTDHPIRVDRARENHPPGGRWQALDPLAQGRVQRFNIANSIQQAHTLLAELQRLRSLDPDLQWRDCAVLAYSWEPLMALRACCEHLNIPVFWGRDSVPALYRVREIAAFLDTLDPDSRPMLNSSELRATLDALPASPWRDLLTGLLDAWASEAGDEPQPVAAINAWFYDSLREYRRRPPPGSGVVFTTIHRAKGLEFPHVFLADGSWYNSGDAATQRRLLYVAMTRARETLHLFQGPNTPHLPALPGDLYQREAVVGSTLPVSLLRRRYEVLALDGIFLDYAGRLPPGHAVHRALAKLQPGDSLRLQTQGTRLGLCDADGVCVAQLSQSATETWQPRLETMDTLRVLAMLRRYREDAKGEFQARLQGEVWEVPVCEGGDCA